MAQRGHLKRNRRADDDSQATQTFEEEVRDRIDVNPAFDASVAPSATDTVPALDSSTDSDAQFADNFEGIDWKRLPRFIKPPRTRQGKKSWIYQHGYRVVSRSNPDQIFFICRYCHQHRLIDAGMGGVFDVTHASSSAGKHLKNRKLRGHGLSPITREREDQDRIVDGTPTIHQVIKNGVQVTQELANAMGAFNVQRLRLFAVSWLVDNNHPLREFETPAFRSMIKFASSEAEKALWRSHNSVPTYIMRLYRTLHPQIISDLSGALSKIHLSFDGWTIKGGKRGFYGIVAHYVAPSGIIRDLPIGLPQLSGVHSGERLGKLIHEILRSFSVHPNNVGYFVLDNAGNNNTAVDTLATMYGFNACERRLRCAPHTLNLVGQTVIFGVDKESFDNEKEMLEIEEEFLREWRKYGALGMLIDVLHHIGTPQQYDKLREFQVAECKELELPENKIMEPVKPVVTRWNSFCNSFERATQIRQPLDGYIQYHIERTRTADAIASARAPPTKKPAAPEWMRSTGLSALDWVTINQYVNVLQPLKEATSRLEGRGPGRFGAIYEVIPTFREVINRYKEIVEGFNEANFSEPDSPEDHLAVNVRAALKKAEKYWLKIIADSPTYYAATCLHPYYKNYCANRWRGIEDSLHVSNKGFQKIWGEYKLRAGITLPEPPPKKVKVSSFDDSIDQYTHAPTSTPTVPSEDMDEFELWMLEPRLSRDHVHSLNPIAYWISLRTTYPHLSQLAIDVLSIPASSCECERMFSEVGNLLEPKRRKIGAQLLQAIHCVRSWHRAGFRVNKDFEPTSNREDDSIQQQYNISEWDQDEEELS